MQQRRSNMLYDRLKSRCKSARKIDKIASIDDYKLVFDRLGDYEKSGGVASIVPCLGEKVFGALYLISGEDIQKLDKIENPTGRSYYRRKITVRTEDDQYLDCNTYLSYPQGEFKPTSKYLNWIIDGAIETKLPAAYIEKLEKVNTAD